MNKTTRRIFMLQLAATGSAIAATPATVPAKAPAAPAAAANKVDEKDPQAAALGYVDNTTRADQKKFPKHTVEQKCVGCVLYQGKPTDPMAPCAIFAGKLVAGPGWCSAYSKRA